MDAQIKAQELSSFVLSASSPSEIAAACRAVESFFRKHPADQSRAFFSVTFPVLIYRVFGFEDVSHKAQRPSGWIDQIISSVDVESASRVFDILSPSSVLMSSIFIVDRHALVRYVFPTERLPEWVRHFLPHDKDCQVLSELHPLFKNRIKKDQALGNHQVQLNVFEYYMFWFAYYPICRGNSENTTNVSVRRSRKFRFENWTSLLPSTLTSSGMQQRLDCNLYIRLLFAYLRAFVPHFMPKVRPPYQSTFVYSSSENDSSVMLRAEFLVYTLITFWLVENDFAPLPINLCCSYDLKLPLHSIPIDCPPSSGLGEVVEVLVKYLICIDRFGNCGCFEHMKSNGVQALRNTDVAPVVPRSFSFVGSCTSLVQRPLYRFILRSFLFCPAGASLHKVSQVFSLWLTYMQPWKITPEDFVELSSLSSLSGETSKGRNIQSRTKSGAGVQRMVELAYTSSWQDYVLFNYLFHSSLVMHFCFLAHKFIQSNPMKIMQMVLELLKVLTYSNELLDVLKKVDAACHSTAAGLPSNDNIRKYVPSIREQIQDWEEGLCEDEADGPILKKSFCRDLRFFYDGEGGGFELLQLLILHGEAEIARMSSDVDQNLKLVTSLKSQVGYLFGERAANRSRPIWPESPSAEHYREDAFTPSNPRKGKQRWPGDKYKGDWMRRPVSDDEVAWLARLLVRISDRLNTNIGLEQGLRSRNDSESSRPGWSYIEMPKYDVDQAGGLSEVVWLIVSGLISWLVVLGQTVLECAKRRGWRVDLRPLASKRIVTIVAVCVVFGAFKRAFGLCSEASLTLTSLL